MARRISSVTMAIAAGAIIAGTSCIAFYDNSMPPGAEVDATAGGDAGGPNACGGWDPLGHEPGDSCGPCDLDHWFCEGTDAVECDGATATCQCRPNDHQECYEHLGLDVYWFDSCGVIGELADACTAEEVCHDVGPTGATCCTIQDHLGCSSRDRGATFWYDSCGEGPYWLADFCPRDTYCVGDGTTATCECRVNEHRRCVGGDVYEFDSCGVMGPMAQDCTADEVCPEDDDWAFCTPGG